MNIYVYEQLKHYAIDQKLTHYKLAILQNK